MIPFDFQASFSFSNSGTSYWAVYRLDQKTLNSPIFDFSFFSNDRFSGRDRGVSDLITEIFTFFMPKADFPVTFICDSSDGRQAARARLFKSWYRNAHGSQLDLVIFELEGEEDSDFIGLIGNRSDSKFQMVYEELRSMQELRKNK